MSEEKIIGWTTSNQGEIALVRKDQKERLWLEVGRISHGAVLTELDGILKQLQDGNYNDCPKPYCLAIRAIGRAIAKECGVIVRPFHKHNRKGDFINYDEGQFFQYLLDYIEGTEGFWASSMQANKSWLKKKAVLAKIRQNACNFYIDRKRRR